ncbi:Pentatricopeptide repeat-containing protein [Hibiscus syriacus]|uniref:Pentatricopeptide repeat-containing protein n=1 Tax=Hibiscus syriacus TaxID=106335 RepID=A0A6A2Z6S5_HIBSY|nr:Pentatricopeptide repeat-containing protein [Hibiscus syriacus]
MISLFEDAESLFERMVHKDVISWSTMIAGLAQNGFSQEALKLFDLMKASGMKPNYITMVGFFLPVAMQVLVHRNVDLTIYAAKQVLKLDPEDAGTYVLLSNIYANSQRWDDVTDIRRQMREKGITKEPGCSWIEVNKQIHAFILGDTAHPKINKINMRLNQLIHKLVGIGYVPDTNFVLQDLEGEQRDDSLWYHSEKLAIVFGLMSLSSGSAIRIRKNLRICGDYHTFESLLQRWSVDLLSSEILFVTTISRTEYVPVGTIGSK